MGIRDLSAESQRIYRLLVAEYRIEDGGGQHILHSGLKALDQAQAAEAQIEREGRTFHDRFGQPRAHPLLAIARDFRAQYVAALKALNLAVGEAPKVGRPEGA